MKLKNHKAQNRRNAGKTDFEETEACEEIEEIEDDSQIVSKVVHVKKRKRCKMFTREEQELLQILVEKYSECLDTSQTRDAIKNRKNSWQTIHDEFNAASLNIPRDLSELKIKYKNMKSNGTSFTLEVQASSSAENTYIELQEFETSPPTEVYSPIQKKPVQVVTSTAKRANIKRELAALKKSNKSEVEGIDVQIMPSAHRRLKRNTIEIENQFENDSDDEFDTDDDDLDDLEYVPTLKKSKFSNINQPLKGEIASTSKTTLDRDEARIRKENLLLKNACLRKKERLLELQIALAERNLRRHELQM